MSQKVAIVSGVTGQDGSYLAELLLEKGYKVLGVKRRNASNSLGEAAHLANEIDIVEADVTDLGSLDRVCRRVRAHEFYNLAAQSHVGTSFTVPGATLDATGAGVLNCLEAIRQSGVHTRFYQASTSELFGGNLVDGQPVPANELTPFHPKSPYAAAKRYGHDIVDIYRESYNMFACCGLLFNHESPRRGPNFVTRKITLGIAAILAGTLKTIKLGNLSASRDWGHAQDYVRGMWLMLDQPHPIDYVLATGESHSVAEFCELAFQYAGLGDYRPYIEIDPQFYRPNEVPGLLGDASRAKRELGWKPEITFHQLVMEMVDADCK